MANTCWFEMRMRGTKANCKAMLNSGISCYDARVKAEEGTENDYMMYVSGECAWSVTDSMLHVDEDETLPAKASRFQLELEVCGLEEGGGSSEHLHYKGGNVIKENNLPDSLPAWGVESGEFGLREEDVLKYDKDEESGMYILKSEFVEKFKFDYEKDKPVFEFSMSIRDLPGFEGWEEPEEEDGGIIVW